MHTFGIEGTCHEIKNWWHITRSNAQIVKIENSGHRLSLSAVIVLYSRRKIHALHSYTRLLSYQIFTANVTVKWHQPSLDPLFCDRWTHVTNREFNHCLFHRRPSFLPSFWWRTWMNRKSVSFAFLSSVTNFQAMMAFLVHFQHVGLTNLPNCRHSANQRTRGGRPHIS